MRIEEEAVDASEKVECVVDPDMEAEPDLDGPGSMLSELRRITGTKLMHTRYRSHLQTPSMMTS